VKQNLNYTTIVHWTGHILVPGLGESHSSCTQKNGRWLPIARQNPQTLSFISSVSWSI